MSFANPAFLWALSALVIPVLIHLFQLRRFKRIDFPNVHLLAEVTQQTRARRKVQHWLVLLSRLLALACLVLAFARPFLPGSAAAAGEQVVSIHVDDSHSMDALGTNGRALDAARTAARAIITQGSPSTRYQVLTGRFQGREQLLVDRDEALESASRVSTGPNTRPLSQVMARQREALHNGGAPVKRAYLITDLQRTITDVEKWTVDSAVEHIIVPIPTQTAVNLSIDSAWFQGPVRRVGQRESLTVRISNRGEQELMNVPLRLTVNGEQRAMTTFSIAGGGTIDSTLHFINVGTGHQWGTIELDDAPVRFDDRLYISYRVQESIRVLLIGGADATSDADIERAFTASGTTADSIHRFIRMDLRAVDRSQLKAQDLIILNALPDPGSGLVQDLGEAMKAGASVAVFPPRDGAAKGYRELLARGGMSATPDADTALRKVDRIDLDKPFYRDIFSNMPRNVDLPQVRDRWNLRTTPGSDVLLRMKDGRPFLASRMVERGSLFVCAAPLAERSGNFTRHGLFAATLLRMAELSRPSPPLYHLSNASGSLPLYGLEPPADRVPHLRGPGGIDIVPELRRLNGGTCLALHDEDLPDGPYAVTFEGDTMLALAFNLDRRESDLRTMTVEELTAAIERSGPGAFRVMEPGDDLSLRLAELDRDRKLWKWFVALALLFLVSEVLLIRFLR
jgi:hypothetical protein